VEDRIGELASENARFDRKLALRLRDEERERAEYEALEELKKVNETIRMVEAETARLKSENARVAKEKLAEDRLRAEECERVECETLKRKTEKTEELKKLQEERVQRHLRSMQEISSLKASRKHDETLRWRLFMMMVLATVVLVPYDLKLYSSQQSTAVRSYALKRMPGKFRPKQPVGTDADGNRQSSGYRCRRKDDQRLGNDNRSSGYYDQRRQRANSSDRAHEAQARISWLVC
jgi:hypothetical protein